jgi:hypothetical protein
MRYSVVVPVVPPKDAITGKKVIEYISVLRTRRLKRHWVYIDIVISIFDYDTDVAGPIVMIVIFILIEKILQTQKKIIRVIPLSHEVTSTRC